jgi:hypothetical protein
MSFDINRLTINIPREDEGAVMHPKAHRVKLPHPANAVYPSPGVRFFGHGAARKLKGKLPPIQSRSVPPSSPPVPSPRAAAAASAPLPTSHSTPSHREIGIELMEIRLRDTIRKLPSMFPDSPAPSNRAEVGSPPPLPPNPSMTPQQVVVDRADQSVIDDRDNPHVIEDLVDVDLVDISDSEIDDEYKLQGRETPLTDLEINQLVLN